MSVPAAGQKTPIDELGFHADKLYDFHGVDAVGLFNLNLTTTLPIGTRYVVSPALSYRLLLVYNGKIYDVETYDCYDHDDNPIRCEDEVPNLRSSAGLGWRVSLGRLLPPTETSANHSSFDRDSFIYEGPAGDEHEFRSTDNEASVILSSDDPVPLRLLKVTGLSLPTRDLELPSGEVHRFQEEHSVWRLKQIRDRYNGHVDIAYTYELVDGNYRETKWTITDTVGRTHTVSFIHQAALAEGWTRGQSVSSIVLDGAGGADNTYTFAYTTSCDSLPVLESVTLPAPDSTSYEFDYGAPYGASSICSALEKINYPTGGSVAYTYQTASFASADNVCFNSPFGSPGANDTPGIATRTVWDGVMSREWKYVQRRGPFVAVDYTYPDYCWQQYGVGTYGPFYWSRTSVLGPVDANDKRVRTDHYFNLFGGLTWYDRDSHPFPEANNLPFGYAGVAGRPPDDRAKGSVEDVPEETTGYPADVSGSDGGTGERYLASRVYSGCDSVGNCTNGALLRSTYIHYDCPVGCQVGSTRIVYEDDTVCGTTCYTQDTSTGRTGSGLYTTATTASNFPPAGSTCASAADCPEVVTSATYTDYAAWPEADRTNANKPWITNTFTERSHTEGTETAKSMYQFSTTTGALEAVRVFKGSTLGTEDILTIFGRDASGNVIQKKSYGGDGASLATVACCETPSSGLDYLIKNTYSNNFLTKSEYLDPTSCTDISQSGCQAVLTTADITTDKWTGLVTAARDCAGVATAYEYDEIGRLETITPTGAATRSYVYTAATSTANALVTETVKDTADAVVSTGTFEFDGLGRVKRTSTTLPNGKLAAVQTDYDEDGRKSRVSQPVEATTHPTSNIGTYWTRFTYDPFGRHLSVTTPDAKTMTFAYSGVRKVARTASIATTIAGSQNATTVEYYDPLGRLSKVEEAAADTSATMTSGGTVSTNYTYDVGGRVAAVAMSDGTTTQDRSFAYDGRRFLTTENHPEQTGDTTYSEYDARGHAGKRVGGGRTVKFAYDAAERLTKVAEVVGTTEKPLKTFTFSTANVAADLQKGKLLSAVRYNENTSAGKTEVKETYTYDTPAGHVSKVTTRIDHLDGNIRTKIQELVYGVEYDDLLLPKTLTMPTCDGCSTTNGLASVTYGRTAGFLTSVPTFASLTYHPSGMVNTVTHQSTPAATDTYAASYGLARPDSITFSGGAPSCATPTASPITRPDSVCAGSAGNTASVTARAGITHTWTIAGGGTITSAATGESITFSAPLSGAVTLTVTATDLCDGMASSSIIIPITEAPAPSTISAPASVCGNSSGNTASVSARSGITHTWTITGGTIASSTAGDSITFTVASSGTVSLSVTATDSACSATATSSTSVPITTTPTASLSGSTTIVRGGAAAQLDLTLTGTAPWKLTWSDGYLQTNVTDSTPSRSVAPDQTTTYTVVPSSGVCNGSATQSATVTVIPPPPANVSATTQENRNVLVTWTAVAGASGYRIERTTRLGATASWSTTVATTTSYPDVVPAGTAPVTYIYYVRTIDQYGMLSERGPWDHATAATLLWSQSPIVSGVTIIAANDVGELRGAINALRYALYLSPAFGGVVAPSGGIRAADFSEMVTALSAVAPFAYSGVPAPAPGGTVLGAHIQQLREALR